MGRETDEWTREKERKDPAMITLQDTDKGTWCFEERLCNITACDLLSFLLSLLKVQGGQEKSNKSLHVGFTTQIYCDKITETWC